MFHYDPFFTIYFGNRQESFEKKSLYTTSSSQELAQKSYFSTARNFMNFDNLLALNQIHSTRGITFKDRAHCQTYKPYSTDGDFLITSVSGVALGVSTADCLPVILYDQKNHLLAMVHVGWKGAVNGIISTILSELQATFSTKATDIKVFFGPCAQVCCYQVTQEFIPLIGPLKKESLHERDKLIYFNLPLYTILSLKEQGISLTSINLKYNSCTICNISYCSYRREGAQAHRQMTLAALR